MGHRISNVGFVLFIFLAIAVSGVAVYDVIQRFQTGAPAETAGMLMGQMEKLNRLPSLGSFKQVDENNNVSLPTEQVVKGLPLAPAYATFVPFGPRKLISIPILMAEPDLPIALNMKLIHPMRWRSEMNSPEQNEELIGRRSMWFMPIGSTMLYSVLMDTDQSQSAVGVSFVVINRLSDDIYDLVIEDMHGNVLVAKRGYLRKINPAIGQGAFEAHSDQSEVQAKYKPAWDIPPEQLPLFSTFHG